MSTPASQLNAPDTKTYNDQTGKPITNPNSSTQLLAPNGTTKMQVVLLQPSPSRSTSLSITEKATPPRMLCGDLLSAPGHDCLKLGLSYFYGVTKPYHAKKQKPLHALPYCDRDDLDTKYILDDAQNYLNSKGATDPDSYYHAARCFLLSSRDPDKKTTVAKYFKKAGEEGHLPAFVAHAICLEIGFGTPMDKNQAAECYAYAADLGDPTAQYALAALLLSGQVVVRNLHHAITLLRSAVDKHHSARAQYLLGHCYANGIVVPKDDKIAVDLFFQATVEGEERAIAAGLGKKPKDLLSPKGVRWVAKSVEPRDLRADFELATRYLTGKTLPESLEQAILRLEMITRVDLSNTARHTPGWYWCSGSAEELKQLCENEIKAMQLLGSCYEKRAASRELNKSNPDDLLSFHFTKKAIQREQALLEKQKLIIQTAEDRKLHSLSEYQDPFGESFAELLKILPTPKNPNTEVYIIEQGQKLNFQCLVVPGKNLVIHHKGSNELTLDVSSIECENLYIICENGDLLIPEYSILKAHANLFCLSKNKVIGFDSCKVQVGRVFAIIGAHSIRSNSTTAGCLSAVLGLFLGPTVGASTFNNTQKRFKEILLQATPFQMKEYANKIIAIMSSELSLSAKNEAEQKQKADDLTPIASAAAFATTSATLLSSIAGAYAQSRAQVSLIDDTAATAKPNIVSTAASTVGTGNTAAADTITANPITTADSKLTKEEIAGKIAEIAKLIHDNNFEQFKIKAEGLQRSFILNAEGTAGVTAMDYACLKVATHTKGGDYVVVLEDLGADMNQNLTLLDNKTAKQYLAASTDASRNKRYNEAKARSSAEKKRTADAAAKAAAKAKEEALALAQQKETARLEAEAAAKQLETARLTAFTAYKENRAPKTMLLEIKTLAVANNVEGLSKLLPEFINLSGNINDYCDNWGTVLHHAAKAGSVDAVVYLVAEANANMQLGLHPNVKLGAMKTAEKLLIDNNQWIEFGEKKDSYAKKKSASAANPINAGVSSASTAPTAAAPK